MQGIVSAAATEEVNVEDMVPESTAFVADYIGVVSAMAENTSIPAETRFTAVADQTRAVVAVADAMSSTKHPDDTFAMTLSEGLLTTARSLSRVIDSANVTVSNGTNINTTVELPENANMPGGFVTAIDLKKAESTILTYPVEQPTIDRIPGKVMGFSINVTGVIGSGVNESESLAGTIVEFSSDALFPDNTTGKIVVSSIILASLGISVSGLSDENRICGTYTYTATNGTADSEPQCVFYNHSHTAWADTGCAKTAWNSTHVTCCCNHLTAFTVVVGGEDVRREDAVILEGITNAGLGLSFICLVLTFVVVAGSRELREQLQSKLLLNLVVALATAHLLFFFISAPTSMSGCQVLSFSMMYFLLASFGWMSVQAHSLYTTFVLANVWDISRHHDRTQLARYSAFAWGGPIIVVFIGAFVDTNGSISTTQSTSGDSVVQFCWFDRNSTIKWFFIIPMMASVLFNVFAALRVIGAVLVQIRKHRVSDADFKQKLVQLVADTKVVFVIASVTGCGWVLALLVVFQVGGLAAQYAFTVATVFQGTMIFYFHVLQKKPGRVFLLSLGWSFLRSISDWSRKSDVSNVVRGARGTDDTGPDSRSGQMRWRKTVVTRGDNLTSTKSTRTIPWRVTMAPVALSTGTDFSSKKTLEKTSIGDVFPTSGLETGNDSVLQSPTNLDGISFGTSSHIDDGDVDSLQSLGETRPDSYLTMTDSIQGDTVSIYGGHDLEISPYVPPKPQHGDNVETPEDICELSESRMGAPQKRSMETLINHHPFSDDGHEALKDIVYDEAASQRPTLCVANTTAKVSIV